MDRKRSGVRANRVVHAPLLAERLAELADRAIHAERLAERRQQVPVAGSGRSHGLKLPGGIVGVPPGPHLRRALQLASLGLRIEPVELDPLGLLFPEAVDADDRALAALDCPLPQERG